MNKFNVGDRVRLNRRDGYGGFRGGEEGTVVRHGAGINNWRVQWDSGRRDHGFHESHLDLVMSATDTTNYAEYYDAITEMT